MGNKIVDRFVGLSTSWPGLVCAQLRIDMTTSGGKVADPLLTAENHESSLSRRRSISVEIDEAS